jgi:hypothetical protein
MPHSKAPWRIMFGSHIVDDWNNPVATVHVDTNEMQRALDNLKLISVAPRMKMICDAALAYLLMPAHLDSEQLIAELKDLQEQLK